MPENTCSATAAGHATTTAAPAASAAARKLIVDCNSFVRERRDTARTQEAARARHEDARSHPATDSAWRTTHRMRTSGTGTMKRPPLSRYVAC